MGKFTLLIQVQDKGEEKSSTSVTVNVNDANEAPTLKKKKDAQGDEISLVERDVDEESGYKKKVGSVIQCEDDDAGDKNSDGECTGTSTIHGHYKEQTETNVEVGYFVF